MRKRDGWLRARFLSQSKARRLKSRENHLAQFSGTVLGLVRRKRTPQSDIETLKLPGVSFKEAWKSDHRPYYCQSLEDGFKSPSD